MYNAEKSSHLCDRQVSALPWQFVSICSHFHTQIPFPPVGMLLTSALSGLAECMACMYDNLRSLCCDLTSTPSCFLVCYSEMSPLDGNASCSHSTIDSKLHYKFRQTLDLMLLQYCPFAMFQLQFLTVFSVFSLNPDLITSAFHVSFGRLEVC